MSERRFTSKPHLDPHAVWSLAPSHAAMRDNTTLFPSTVVTVTDAVPDRILVSGRNNRKIGAIVEKGQFKGYGIYCLSLEERATCPGDCSARGFCYGNGMQMARRHRIGDPDVFFDRIGFEIAELLDQHPGILIRLHVLGDFPSVEYVSFWKDVLDEHPNVACFGYTHRFSDVIADAIQSVKEVHHDRFRIRWSTDKATADRATVIDHVPTRSRTNTGDLVCPSQKDATACCATCALCWEAPAETIAFIKHGPKGAPVAPVVMAERSAEKLKETKVVAEQSAVGRTSAGLRDALFDALDGVRNGRVDPHSAKAIAGLAREIVNTVKLELEIHKLGKPIKPEDQFWIAALPLGSKELDR